MRENLERLAKFVLDGVMFHQGMTDLFGFLQLKGFYKWQKCQRDEELEHFDKIKCYIYKKYHMFIDVQPSDTGEITNVIPENWRGHSALDASSSDVANAVRDAIDKYIQWEKMTKDKIKSLLPDEDDACLINEMLKDVCEEIQKVECLKMKLQSTGYNTFYIQWIQEKYK